VNWLQMGDEGFRILFPETKKQLVSNEWPKHLRLPYVGAGAHFVSQEPAPC
jgi:hypothetical protein